MSCMIQIAAKRAATIRPSQSGSAMKNTSMTTVPLGSPLYTQVKQAVLAALARGEWKQGDAVPPEKTLAERFGVSIGTLRQALDELAAENLLVRHQRSAERPVGNECVSTCT